MVFWNFGCVIQPLQCDRHWEILSWAWTRMVSTRVVAWNWCLSMVFSRRCETPAVYVTFWGDGLLTPAELKEGLQKALRSEEKLRMEFLRKFRIYRSSGNRMSPTRSSPLGLKRVRPAWRKFLQISSKLWRLGSNTTRNIDKLRKGGTYWFCSNLLSTGIVQAWVMRKTHRHTSNNLCKIELLGIAAWRSKTGWRKFDDDRTWMRMVVASSITPNSWLLLWTGQEMFFKRNAVSSVIVVTFLKFLRCT